MHVPKLLRVLSMLDVVREPRDFKFQDFEHMHFQDRSGITIQSRSG